ncbi:hypothetical protein JCM9279_004681 [Rhodotorula babjevae]
MLRRAADDSSLAAAFGGRLSPSPWSRFLSPSLFSQRSSTPTQTLAPPLAAAAAPPAAGSPLKESTTTAQQAHQPGQFTHAREINPFERSFASLDGTAAILPRGADGGSAPFAAGGAGLHLGGRLKRKRALSSPALFTPGGSPQPDYLANEAADEDDDMRAFLQAKRPGLRFVPNNDSGVGFVEAGPAVDMLPSQSSYSLRSRGSSSGHNSFDSTTGTSLLGRRRAHSASDSPDTSVAPSPPSPKLGVATDANQFGGQAQPSTFTHFQPQPLAFSMPPSTTVAMPYGDPSVLALSTLGPASIAPHAVAPLPFTSEPQPFEPVAMPLDPMASFVAAYPTAPQPFAPAPPNPTSLAAPLPHPLGRIPHPVPAPAMHTGPSPVAIPHSRLPPMPPSTRAPPAAPVGAQAFIPAYAPPPPAPAAAAAASTARTSKKASPVAGPSRQLGPAPLYDEADEDDDAAPAAPTRPAGKKRGRKPKNWDPTLETTVELDPEEQEKQRKLALERNRVAASKSRRRKKERVELLETASTDLCSRNLALQAECRNLFTEVHALRTMLAQAHPEHSCQCPHIVGYVVREREGGGIPAILYGASGTTERDYTRVPKWGTEDDVFAGTVEAQALDVIAGGGSALVDMVGGRRGAGEYPRATSSIRSDTPGPSMHYQHQHQHAPHAMQPVPMVAPVAVPHHVGVAAGQVRQPLPLKAPSASASTGRSPPKKARASAAAALGDGEGDSDESEEETVTLKSRRARTISTRNK